MVELLFLCTLSRGMRDGLLDLPSLGQAAGFEHVTDLWQVRYICSCIYYTWVRKTRQPLKDEHLYSDFRMMRPQHCTQYSMVPPPSETNLPLFLQSFVPVLLLSGIPSQVHWLPCRRCEKVCRVPCLLKKEKGSFCFVAEDPCGDDIQLYLCWWNRGRDHSTTTRTIVVVINFVSKENWP